MTPQAIVDLLLSLLPVVASIAPSVYAALFGTATVESMTTRAREALAKAGGTRAAMEALFEPHPVAAAVAREMPQVSAHTSDRIRGLSGCSSLTAEDREACAKGAAFIEAVVTRSGAVKVHDAAFVADLVRDLGPLRAATHLQELERDSGIPAKFVRTLGTADTEPAPATWGDPKEGD
jgi:hypothetical protein